MKKTFFVLSLASLLSLPFFSPPAHAAMFGTDVPDDAKKVLDWCKANAGTIQKAMARGDVFYEKVGTPRSVYSKQLAEKEVFQFYPFPNIITRSPIYSKSHNKLYFIATDTAYSKTHLIAIPTSGDPEYVYTYDGEFRYYDISPDGKEIVFSTLNKNQPVTIMRYPLGYSIMAKKLIQVTDASAGAQFPCYSPDGNSIVYTMKKNLMIRDLKTNTDRVLVNDTMMKELPKWSPDGKWIAYQAWTGLKTDGFDIYKVNPANGFTMKLTYNPELDANPSFDKTGKWIIYITTPQNADAPGNRISVIDLDGENQLIDPTSLPKCWFPVY